jgi:hypothetical protein
VRWLHRSQAVAPTADLGGVGVNKKIAENAIHDSPALTEIFAALDPDRPVRVLDLGSALQTNLEFYSTIGNGVRIVPLLRNDGLEGLHALDAEAFSAMLDSLLPTEDEGFGLILAWDLFDYLVDDQPALLARHLAGIAERGARIHVMIITGETMPAKPSRYEILDAGRLAYRPTTNRNATAPDPPPAKVERWLAPFRVERSFLLRHGVREFIAVNG